MGSSVTGPLSLTVRPNSRTKTSRTDETKAFVAIAIAYFTLYKGIKSTRRELSNCLGLIQLIMVSKIANKNVLLIGGTSGIGFAVAKQALADGATVTITSSSEERVSRAAESLRNNSPTRASAVRSYVADLSIKDELDTTIEKLLKYAAEISPIDHIVFTAGNVPPMVPLAEASFSDLDAYLTVRLFGAMAVGKYAPKYMVSSKSSSITLTTGTQSKKPSIWLAPAVAGSVEGLMKGLAITLGPIRVNAVSPGFILTELTGRLPKEMKEGAIEKYTQQSLTKDIGYPEDTAEAYLYLMKDYFVTGSTVATNGGAWLV
jgi:NAD(P)-dependent dehydrogenase (short-subunit alcohol dehydrogenase family)